MPVWNAGYYESLQDKFRSITEGIDERIEDVIEGRVAPAIDDITIGSGRKLRAAILFFDIRGFSNLTGSPDMKSLKQTLIMLDVTIPMVMQVIYDFGGYIEKNTGDGIMAVLGAELDDVEASDNALSAATTIFYLLTEMINPYLQSVGIAPINARIGIDLGTLLIARLGVPTGSAKHDRNFLTAIGPAANLANKIQRLASTNKIWVGDNIFQNASEWRKHFFIDKTPNNWDWTYSNNPSITYRVWEYNAVRTAPK